MRPLLAALALLGATFACNGSSSSSASLPAVIHDLQQSILAGDVSAMQRMCASGARADCERLIQQIRGAESEAGTRLDQVISINFDLARGAQRVEGTVTGSDARGSELFSATVAVEQRGDGGPWRIVAIH